jgi:hypothetical protein
LQLQIDLNVCSREFDEPVPFVDQVFVERVVRIACNESEELAVDIPMRVLFLKSIILSLFVARMRKGNPTFYVSPRRQARMLELLRLSALLDGRIEVDESDLSSLRYMAGILNGEAHEVETFVRTLEETLRFFDVDPKLKQTMLLVSTVFDLARKAKSHPTKIEDKTWKTFQDMVHELGLKKRDGDRWRVLLEQLEALKVTSLDQLDTFRLECIKALRGVVGHPHAL